MGKEKSLLDKGKNVVSSTSRVTRKKFLKIALVGTVVGATAVGMHSTARVPSKPKALKNASRKWSIGIYTGCSPLNVADTKDIENPVLTADDVTDIPASFVADPFMIKANSKWYMFFEVFNKDTKRGEIGLAISDNGFDWTYKQIVLDEPFHLSYPNVFKWNNEYYMVPESHKTRSIRLYKATDFPTKWSFVKTLLKGSSYRDSSIFRYDDKWWMFTTNRDDMLYLCYADDLFGPWSVHPKSPVIQGDPNIARPGGRVLVYDGSVFRFTQDCHPHYGNKVRAFQITTLTTTDYEEKEVAENPVLDAGDDSWNNNGMHHIDPHQLDKDKWIAVVDGH